MEILIPDDYVESITERLSLYQRLDNCENEEALQAMIKEIEDRFGPIPQPVIDLFETVRIRKLAIELGFEKMSLKDHTLRCFFINRPDSPYYESVTFDKIIRFLQTESNKGKLKQTGRLFMLIGENMQSMEDIYRFLKQMHRFVFAEKSAIA